MLVMIISRYPSSHTLHSSRELITPMLSNDIYVSDSYASLSKLWTSLIRCPIDIPTYLKGIPYISCLGPQQKKKNFFKKGKSNMLSPFSQLKTNTIHKSLNNLATVFLFQPHLISHCTFSLLLQEHQPHHSAFCLSYSLLPWELLPDPLSLLYPVTSS